jgi:hypothetical protein
MTNPPRTGEVLIQSLGARASICEPLLGDLAEAFAVRAKRDGATAARRWYYREVVRAMPHLLWDWARSMRFPDVVHFAGVVFTSLVFTLMLTLLAMRVVQGVADMLGLPQLLPLTTSSNPALITAVLLMPFAAMVLAGYIAAWLNARAPIASAIALGLTWSASTLAIAFIGAGRPPLVLVVFIGLFQLLGPTLGGLLRVRVLAREKGRYEARYYKTEKLNGSP